MGLMVSEKKIFKFSQYKSMGVDEPQGVANLDPMGLICRIYVRFMYFVCVKVLQPINPMGS